MAKQEAVVILRAEDKASRVLGKVGSSFKGLGRIFSSTAAQLIGVGSLTFAFTAATTAAIGFEKGIAEIKTLGIEKTIAEVSGEVRALSREFGTKPQAAIKSYYDAISAGVKESEIVGFLGEASKLALAGATDVSIATDILTGLRQVFKDTDEILAATVNATKNLGKTTVEQLRKIGVVAPIAAELGVTFQELSASIANATIVIGNTDRTLTGLRAAFSAVLKPSTQALEVAERLGIDFSAAAVATKGWIPFLAELSEKTKGNATDLVTLFGSVEAFSVISVLAKDNAQGLSDTFAGIRKEVETGALQEAADIMKDTAAVRLDILKAEFAAVTGEIIERLLPSIVSLAKGLTDIIGLATGRVFEDEFVPPLKNVGAQIRSTQDEIQSLLNVFGEQPPEAVKAEIRELENELAALELQARRVALEALPSMEEEVVTLANQLRAQGVPTVDAYNQAIRQLSIAQVREKETADAATESEVKAAEARAAATIATLEAERASMALVKSLPKIGETFEAFLPGVESLMRVEERLVAMREKVADLGAAITQTADPEALAILGESLIASIRDLDPELGAEAITEKLAEIFPEIDFAALAEEVPFFAELLKNANPEDVGSAVGEALKAAQGPITDFTGGITELQSALSVLGVTGAGGFGKFAKATAKIQAVISTAQALFEIAQAIAAIASFRFGDAAKHGLAATKFQISASGAKKAEGAIAAQAGGFVPMLPGASANRDSVLAALTPGEFVIPKPAVDEMAGLFNRGGRAGRFQVGGVVEEGIEAVAPAGGAMISNVFLVPSREVAEALMEEMTDLVRRFGGELAASEVEA